MPQPHTHYQAARRTARGWTWKDDAAEFLTLATLATLVGAVLYIPGAFLYIAGKIAGL